MASEAINGEKATHSSSSAQSYERLPIVHTLQDKGIELLESWPRSGLEHKATAVGRLRVSTLLLGLPMIESDNVGVHEL